MARYKFENEENSQVFDSDNNRSGIKESSRYWVEYQMWISQGNTTDTWKSQEELDAEATEEARLVALEARVVELEAELEAAGVRDMTPLEVKTWIDDERAAAVDNGELIDVIFRILKKLAVHVLKA